MPPELQDGADPSTPQTPETPPPEPVTTSAGEGTSGESGTVHKVPQSEFKRLKEKAREKGREAAMAEINSQLKSAGFDSLDGLLSTVTDLKQKIASKPEPQPKEKDDKDMAQNKRSGKQRSSRSPSGNGKGNARVDKRHENEISRLSKERQKAMEKWRREEKRRKDAEKRLAAKDAEMELREVAIQAGVKDVDYAIRLMTRHLKGKPKEELASFDEREYFTSLKTEKPYLFGEVNIPATTGTGAGSEDSPPEPGPGEVSSKTGEAQMFDARKASKEEIDARLNELGLGGSSAIPAPPSSHV